MSGLFGRNTGLVSVHAARGFTLLELIIVMVITGILASLAVPSFNKSIRDNRVVTSANAFQSGLTTARNEAIRRGATVTICSTTNPNATTPACGGDYSTGWLIYSGTLSAATLIAVGNPGSSIATTTSTTVPFSSRGMAAATASVVFKASPCTAGIDKKITVSVTTTGLIHQATGTCP